jgi:ABC-type transporter Mla MlaB component
MATAFKLQSGASTGFAALSGRLTFKEGCRFWREQRPEDWSFKVCYIDLSGVTACVDNGVAWLHIFLRWTRTVDVEVYFVNAPPAIEAALIAGGVPVHHLKPGHGAGSR